MKTPQEINKELAERVMRWHESNDGSCWLDADGKFMAFLPYSPNVDELLASPIWDPCHRIDHAWMVVEKLLEKQQELIVVHHAEQRPEDDIRGWYCTIGYDGKFEGKADTASAAICLAALKAVEVEHEKK